MNEIMANILIITDCLIFHKKRRKASNRYDVFDKYMEFSDKIKISPFMQEADLLSGIVGMGSMLIPWVLYHSFTSVGFEFPGRDRHGIVFVSPGDDTFASCNLFVES